MERDEMKERLDRLDAQARAWKILASAVVLALVGLFLFGV